MRYNFTKQTFDILRSKEAERENKSEKNKDKIISGLRGSFAANRRAHF